MSEQTEHTSPQDVLQSSALAARLLRRLVASPGVIDTQRVFKTYARLTKFITHAHPLLQDLLARYSVADDSAVQNLPLVMDQPWMLNLNTYLTNNSSSSSSSSSTTNNSFFAGNTINQSILQSTTSSTTNTQLIAETSQPLPPEKFRISRRLPEKPTSVSADSHDDVLNPMPRPMAHVEVQPLTLVKIEDTKTRPTKPAHLTELRSTTDRAEKSVFIRGEKTSLVLKDSERIKEVKHSTAIHSTETRRALNMPDRAPAASEISAPTTRPTQPAVPLVQEQPLSPRFESRSPQLIWRKNADNQSLRDFVTDVSSSTSAAAVRQALDSLPATQAQSNAQFSKPESSSRADESSTSEEITTEGMLRRISKMLLIERERRGY